jgi:hypothetical protein
VNDVATRYSPEQVYLNAIQMHAGQSVLWDSLASLLISGKQIDAQHLFNMIAYQRANVPAPQDGPLCRSVTYAAMKAILISEYGEVSKAPEWALKVLSGELVPTYVTPEEFVKLSERKV